MKEQKLLPPLMPKRCSLYPKLPEIHNTFGNDSRKEVNFAYDNIFVTHVPIKIRP